MISAAAPGVGPDEVTLALTRAQAGIWFAQQLAPSAPSFYIGQYTEIEGRINVDLFLKSLRLVLKEVDALRARVVESRDGPHLVVSASLESAITFIDLSSDVDPHRAVAEWIKLDMERHPNLDWWRHSAVLLKKGPDQFTWYVRYHHMLMDGFGMWLIAQHVAHTYTSLDAGGPVAESRFIPLSRLLEEEVTYRESGQFDGDRRHWGDYLAGAPAALSLSSVPRTDSNGFLRVASRLDAASTEAIRSSLREIGASLVQLATAAVAILLHRMTGARDIVVGVTVAARSQVARQIPGMASNIMPVRLSVEPNMSVRDLLAEVSREISSGLDRQRYQIHDIRRDLGESGGSVIGTTVNVLRFDYDLSFGPHRSTTHNLSFGWVEDLSVAIHERNDGDGIWVNFDANPARYDRDELSRHHERFIHLLRTFGEPSRPLNRVPMLLPEEHDCLTRDWMGPTQSVPTVCVHEAFERQAKRTPTRLAVRHRDRSITYEQLDCRSNWLAWRLRGLNVALGNVVGIRLERSAEMIVALLGILKAGAAFLPIDPHGPYERTVEMLRDSDVKVLVSGRRGSQAESAFIRDVVELTEDDAACDAEVECPSPAIVHVDDLAYVMYTSGSTGRPKGVMVRHGSVVNLLHAVARQLSVGESDWFLALTPITFDISILELLGPLLVGGGVVIADRSVAMDAKALAAAIVEPVTVLQATPSTYRMLIASGWRRPNGLKVLVGGEALSSYVATGLLGGSTANTLWNMYGPTETTVWSTASEIGHNDDLTIGRPVLNTQVYILDAEMQPAPIGAPGELWIGGSGLARGYQKQPALTAERFVPSPFGVGERIYRTGDVAKWRADGRLEYLGRIDNQIKLRGHRIEPGEIEAAIMRCPEVRDVIVVAHANSELDERLVAYIAPGSPAIFSRSKRQDGHERWRPVFDTAYEAEAADPLVDFATWKSSFTDQPISSDEMLEWVGGTVERIRALRPQCLLEIGCGIGLLARRLAPECVSYVGTDVSPTAIIRLQRDKRQSHHLRNCEFHCRPAQDLSGFGPGSFDTIVLNSVVQYFDSEEMLTTLIKELVRLLRPGGAILVGDVRNLRLLAAFCTAVEFERSAKDVTIGALRRTAWLRAIGEKELLFDPSYFTCAIAGLPDVATVDVQLKRARVHNEISCYRYDVVVRVGPRPDVRLTASEWDWRKDAFDVASLKDRLVRERPAAVIIPNIPNARVKSAICCAKLVEQLDASALVGLAKEKLAESVGAGVDPEVLWQLAEQLNYLVRVEWSESANDQFTLVLVDPEYGDAHAISLTGAYEGRCRSDDISLSNDPSLWEALESFTQDLPKRLAADLPAYMIPSRFVLLDALPLTSSGKVDRRALPGPMDVRGRASADVELPQSPVEEAVAAIFAQVLNLTKIGRDENFFRLGGHSLLAMQVIAGVQDRLGFEISLSSFFKKPTPRAIAELIEAVSSTREKPLSFRLPRSPAGRIAPASFSQEGIWFLEHSQDLGSAYHMTFAVRLHGPLDMEAFEQSVAGVVARHDVLRARFELTDGVPHQVVEPEGGSYFRVLDIAADRECEQLWPQLVAAASRRRFDLSSGPLFRVDIVKVGSIENIVVITMHHIISDERSLSLIASEIGLLYRLYRDRSQLPMPFPQARYGDHALWQRERLVGALLAEQLQYWAKQLSGAPPELDLPVDLPRPKLRTYRGGTISFAIPQGVTASLRDLAREEGATLFMVLLAAFQTALARWSRQSDIVVGAPISERRHVESQDIVGLFVNILPLRIDLSGNPSFRAAVVQARCVCLEAYAHQDLPFEKLVEFLRPLREHGQHPIFQTCFVLQSNPPPTIDLPEVVARPVELDNVTSKFDLGLTIRETPDVLLGSLEYASDLFFPATIERFVGHLKNLLESAAAGPDAGIHSLAMLTEREREQLEALNATSRSYPRELRLHEAFGRQVERTPDAVAVIHRSSSLTYRELEGRANQLAHHLRGRGVGAGDIVGICVGRSINMLVGLLGILKSGAGYVPLDPEYPRERIELMLADSKAAVVVTETATRPAVRRSDEMIVDLDRDARQISALSDLDPACDCSIEDLAYIIYTSGSTGRPKGVAVSHRSAVAFVSAMQQQYSSEELSGTLVSTSLCFDVSVFEIFVPLYSGGTAIISESILEFEESLTSAPVTMMSAVPSVMRELLRTGRIPDTVRTITLAGEALDVQLARDVYRSSRIKRLWNAYGPTECTVYATAMMFPPDPKVSLIGRPIANAKTYVLDTYLEPAPIGVVGELYISGEGLARGYLNQPAATADRFIPNPFGNGTRLYRTGDLVRRIADGDLEFLGRTDHQVKIRGFRIELGEVESILLKHASIRGAVVLAKEWQRGDTRLIAYLTARENAKPSSGDLRARLKQVVPEYMIPSHFVFLDQFPVTPTGKLDRKALPAPPDPVTVSRHAKPKPMSSLEQTLAKIWSEVLGIPDIGVDDDFFDLGGHSLLAFRLIARIREQLDVQLRPSILFQAKSIAGLAAQMVDQGLVDGSLCLLKEGSKGRVYLLHATDGDVLAYSAFVKSLGNDAAIYGVRARVASGGTIASSSIQEIAAQYADVICSANESEPIALIGWSFGGLLAIEIARRMAIFDRWPSFIGLVDTYHPQQIRAGGFDADVTWRKIAHRLDPQHAEAGILEGIAQLHRDHWKAMCEYVPQPIHREMHFYEAREPDELGSHPDIAEWNKLSGERMRKFQIEGSHFSMMQEPVVADLAALIGSHISAKFSSLS